jgi:hypothetical protein
LLIEFPLTALNIMETLGLNSAETSRVFAGWYKMEAIVYTAVDSGISFSYVFHAWRLWGLDSDPKMKRALKNVAFMAAFRIFVDLTYAIGTFTMPYTLLLGINVSRKRPLRGIDADVFNFQTGLSFRLQAEGGDSDSESANEGCDT